MRFEIAPALHQMAASTSCSPEVERLHSLLASGELIHPYLSAEHFQRRFSPKPKAKDEHDGSPSLDDNEDDVRDNFVDLAAALCICCGASPPDDSGNGSSDVNNNSASFFQRSCASNSINTNIEEVIKRRRLHLASEIGGTTRDDDGNETIIYERRHIILILCDGMGNSILRDALLGEEDALSTDQSTSAEERSSFFVRNNQQSRLRAVFPSTTPAALTTLATASWPGRHGEVVY